MLQVYHSTQYATFKADHPGVEAAELNKLMLTAWDALEQSDKDTYQQKADEVAEAAAAAKVNQLLPFQVCSACVSAGE
jgi:hypothetical protein